MVQNETKEGNGMDEMVWIRLRCVKVDGMGCDR